MSRSQLAASNLALWLLAAVELACRVGSAPIPIEHPRQRLFPTPGESPIAEELSEPGRLKVFFLPDPGCAPYEIEAAAALRQLAHDFSDIEVYTVLPQGLTDRRWAGGAPLPGAILTVPDPIYIHEAETVPTPRLEVWSGRRLLLLRSLPPSVTEEQLYEEVLWSRSFTSPVETTDG